MTFSLLVTKQLNAKPNNMTLNLSISNYYNLLWTYNRFTNLITIAFTVLKHIVAFNH